VKANEGTAKDAKLDRTRKHNLLAFSKSVQIEILHEIEMLKSHLNCHQKMLTTHVRISSRDPAQIARQRVSSRDPRRARDARTHVRISSHVKKCGATSKLQNTAKSVQRKYTARKCGNRNTVSLKEIRFRYTKKLRRSRGFHNRERARISGFQLERLKYRKHNTGYKNDLVARK